MAWKGSNKYFARKVVYKGDKYDSTHERDRLIQLEYMQKKGKISCLRTQREFLILTATTKLIPVQLKTKVRYDKKVVEQDARYTCDFIYKEGDNYILEEFKSEKTAKLADYILRRKLMMKKIQEHNKKGRGRWIFREVVYYFDKNKPNTIEDKEV